MGLFCCFCLFFNYNFYLEEARENSGYGLKQVGKIYFSRKHDEGLRTHSLAPTEKKKTEQAALQGRYPTMQSVSPRKFPDHD